MNLGQRIEAALEHRKKSQKWLAEQIGHSPPWVNELLGKDDMKTLLSKRIAKSLGLTLDELTADDDETFLAALHDPAADPDLADDVPSRQASESRSGAASVGLLVSDATSAGRRHNPSSNTVPAAQRGKHCPSL